MGDGSGTGAIRRCDGGVVVDVIVVPNASRAEVVGLHGDRVKVKVASPPERNKANAAVIDLLCRVVGVRRAEVIAGRTTRFKTVLLPGADATEVAERLLAP